MKRGRGGQETLAAGGPARHIPVLLEEVMKALAVREGGLYLDGTFGAGGYTRAILDIPGTRVLALDRDPDAIAAGQAMVKEYRGRLMLEKARFSTCADVARALKLGPFDGATFDIGVSSMQLDEAARGFSFRFEGPLDMRMEQAGRSAADIVNQASEEEIANILYYYGEERASRRIARAIVHDRNAKPFTTTRELAELIGRLLPGKPTEINPATRTFQGLRIAVNDELGELVQALAGAERILTPQGRLAVVSFHSLEDRIVKQFFALRSGRGQSRSRLLPGEPVPARPTFDLPPKQPVSAGPAETRDNPRARSARLRAGIRTNAPALGVDPAVRALAALPAHSSRGR
ncbi:MAG: 16S rRNA (cytosine(1402)-N(4))-methyltransferase RsmH [Beijerinckiaceae bacterium]|nr:16S rRNA (cytosine(1402)-N(4))-methyltransferase RsmH [Beijerinckiaceae bacterium]